MDRFGLVAESTRVKRDRKPAKRKVPRQESEEEIVVAMPEGLFGQIVQFARYGAPPPLRRPLARQAEAEREVLERLAKADQAAKAGVRSTK